MGQKGILKAQLDKRVLQSILQWVKNISVGVIGDACLDIYWDVDMTLSKLSREIPHYLQVIYPLI